MMNFSRPILALSFPFILGILLGKYLVPLFPFSYFISGCGGLLLMAFSSFTFLVWTRSRYFLVGFFFTFFLLGMFHVGLRLAPPPPGDLSDQKEADAMILHGRIVTPPEERLTASHRHTVRRLVFDVAIDRRWIAPHWRGARGTLRTYLKIKHEGSFHLQVGEEIELSGQFFPPQRISNPGLVDVAERLRQEGISGSFFLQASQLTQDHADGIPFFYRVVDGFAKLRLQLASLHHQLFPPPYDGLMLGMVFGNHSASLPSQLTDCFRRAGLTHLLVASGSQVSLLVGTSLLVARYMSLPIWVAALAATLLNGFFFLIAGGGWVLFRAALMGQLTICGLMFRQETEVWNSLFLSLWVILCFDPLALFSVGLQFSFLATISLVYLAPLLEEQLVSGLHFPLWLARSLSVSLAPVLLTQPIVFYYFSQVNWVAPFANLLALPLAAAIVILGVVVTVVGFISFPVAKIISLFSFLLLFLLNTVATFWGNLGMAQSFFPQPSLPMIVGIYILIFSVSEGIFRRRWEGVDRRIIRLLGGGIFAAICLAHVAVASLAELPFYARPHITLTMIDVGQGDSLLLTGPTGKHILIDGGGVPDRGEEDDPVGTYILVPFLHRHGIQTLDFVVLTHPHEDHLGGLVPVLKQFQVKGVLDSAQVAPESRSYRDFLLEIKRKQIPYYVARAGMRLDLGGGLSGKVLAPQRPFIEYSHSDLNNNSVVIRLTYGKVALLLTGDMEQEGEDRLMKTGENLQAQILKVGHHGSGTSSAAPFLSLVQPQIALISCGEENKFGHPHPQTLRALKQRGIHIYRTDQEGAITVRTDGKTISIETARQTL